MTAASSERSTRTVSWRVLIRLIIIAVIALAFIAPILWIVMTSLRPTEDALRYTSPFQRRTVIPDRVTAANYRNLADGPFLRAVLNSFSIAVASVVLGVGIAAAAAYAFATVRFKFRGALFAAVVFAFMIPFEVLAIPLSGTVRDLGLTNSYIALILPGIGNGLAVFLLRQFFLGIPVQLSEAATLDGASWPGIFWRIYLPLSKSALISAGLMIFLFQWQAYLWPLLIVTDSDHQVGSVALAQFFGQSYDADYGLIFAGATVLAVVPAVLLLAFQRQFVASAASSGLKG